MSTSIYSWKRFSSTTRYADIKSAIEFDAYNYSNIGCAAMEPIFASVKPMTVLIKRSDDKIIAEVRYRCVRRLAWSESSVDSFAKYLFDSQNIKTLKFKYRSEVYAEYLKNKPVITLHIVYIKDIIPHYVVEHDLDRP